MKVAKEYLRTFGCIVLTAGVAGLAFDTNVAAWRELFGFGGMLCLLAALMAESGPPQ
jgi:hypothetical protein